MFFVIFPCLVEDSSVLFCFINEKGKAIPLLFFLSQPYFILKWDIYPWEGFYIILYFFQRHMPVLF